MTWVVDPETQVEVWVPVFATPGRALARERARREGRLRRIRLTPDFGHPWPLWCEDSEPFDLTPEDLGLSVGLTAELRAWYDEWFAFHDPAVGWLGGHDAGPWKRQRTELRDRLAREVWDFAEVIDDEQ